MAAVAELCNGDVMEFVIEHVGLERENMAYTMHYQSMIGPIMAASDGDALIGLWMDGQKYYGDTVTEEFVPQEKLPVFTAARKWLDGYFTGKKPPISDLPLAPRGGEFRKAVWEILCEIPYGGYMTYGGIAKKMAVRMNKESMSSQAVGGAVGHNPISIIIPCHRVVGANGSLTGYAGGINKKIALLELEGVNVARFFAPKKGTAL